MDLPLGMRILAEGYIGYARLASLFSPTHPEMPEGFETVLYGELGEMTAVGLDVGPEGDVYVAVSQRQRRGTSDNRMKPYWLLDDLAAESVEDRQRYIEKWAERGRDPISWYTAYADFLLRLRDTSGDGRADDVVEVARFQEILTGIGSSVLVVDDAIWFTDIPDLWRLRDGDGDGVAEQREVWVRGFGVTTSLGGHDLHGLTWGPDGRIYFSMGDRGYNVRTPEGEQLRPPLVVSRGAVFRMWPDGSGLEVFATGLRNPQDLVFDDFGNLFTGDNNADGVDQARLVYVMEGSDSGWAMPFQSLEGEYFHGPWEAERLWETQHPGQPAWILPPVGYVARGPAGMAMDPGLGGLPEDFRGRILIADYQYIKASSGVDAYAVEAEGAGFRLLDRSRLVSSVLPTDLAFGPDGALYLTEFEQFELTSRVFRMADPQHLARPEVVALREMLAEGFDERATPELVELLGHPDRRARRGAQHALARREAVEVLASVASDRKAPLLARIHALWGLGQIGAPAVEGSGWRDLAWSRDDHPEVRVQVLGLVGEVGASAWSQELIEALQDDSAPRAQARAARSLGRVGGPEAVEPLLEVLRENQDRDVFLRHSVVYSLEQIGAMDTLLAWSTDPSASVRMGVLLALRGREDPRIEIFLRDPDPALMVEAARAIYDAEITEALPALASLAGTRLPLDAEGDRQSTQALHRRVIAANLALGGPDNALALARHAADAANPASMRALALEALGDFSTPPAREPVLGFYRGWEARPPQVVYPAVDLLVPALLGTEYEGEALEIALSYGRVPLSDAELLDRVEGWFVAGDVKVASLRVLVERRSPLLQPAIDAALRSGNPAVRAAARDALAVVAPEAAVVAVAEISSRAPELERQRAYATLARAASPAADSVLDADLSRLVAGEFDPVLALDLVEAAQSRGPALAPALARYIESLPPDDLVAQREIALQGGDAKRGRRVFEGPGDCQRCHAVEGVRSQGRAGPDLAGIGARRDRIDLLRSLVDPGAEIVPGFASVRVETLDGTLVEGVLVEETPEVLTLERGGDQIRLSRAELRDVSGRSSAMPAMGLALSLPQLRDLIEYLSTQ